MSPPQPKLGQRLKCIAAQRRMEERAERGRGAVSNAGPRRRGLLNGTIVCPSNRKPLFGTDRGGWDESGRPRLLFPGWLLPSHQVRSARAGSVPDQGL